MSASPSAPRHIAVIAPALPGHWDPLKVLAGALTARGHRVTFVHMGDAEAMVAGTGFDFAGVGAGTHPAGSLARYRRQLADATSLRGFFAMLRATEAISAMLLRTLPGALRAIGADAVIADDAEAAGAMAARRAGLPFVGSSTGLPLMREDGVPPPFVGWAYREGAWGRYVNRGGYRIADLLLQPMARMQARQAARWGMTRAEAIAPSPLLHVAQCPPSLDFPRRELPESFHYCGPFRAPPGPAPDLPKDGRPLVYCSLGSLQGERRALFAAMSGACADLGARAVIAHGGLLGDAAAQALPGDPIVGAYWPQPAVLPRCRAAILHGGFNTVLDAAAAGVPMLVTPLAFEQPGIAARVSWSGAGRAIQRGPLTRERLRTELSLVLSEPSYRTGAERLQTEIARLGGASLAVDLIEAALRAAPRPAARA